MEFNNRKIEDIVVNPDEHARGQDAVSCGLRCLLIPGGIACIGVVGVLGYIIYENV